MASSHNESVLVLHQEDVTTVTFNRPHLLNAVDKLMSEELAVVAEAIPTWSSRVIVLRGAGSSFMAGGDLRAMAAADDLAGDLEIVIGNVHRFSLALARAAQPVVAVMRGAVAGYGLSLAISCDFSLCARDASLSFAYRRLGVTCDGGPSYTLPRLVGAARSAALLLLRDSIPPDEAEAVGMITAVTGIDILEDKVRDVIHTLLANDRKATEGVKRLLRGDIAAFEAALVAERQSFIERSREPPVAEGIRAFLEKRPPRFNPPPR